jgi:hypothetical protein
MRVLIINLINDCIKEVTSFTAFKNHWNVTQEDS